MGEIRVGRPQVKPDFPTHVRGIVQGNSKGNFEKDKGFHKDGTANARRSTGVQPSKHNAILKVMPNLPPG